MVTEFEEVFRIVDRVIGPFQQQLDRRFMGLENDVERRFINISKELSSIKTDIRNLEGVPRDNFRAYILPIILSVTSAIIIALIVKQQGG